MFLLNSGVGKDWAGPFFPPPLYYFLTFLFIPQSLGLTYSCTVSEHSWLSCPKKKFKLRKHLANCIFLLNSGVGKDCAGPFFPPPPSLGSNLSIYLSGLGLNYSYTESEHSWLTYLKEKFKLQTFSQMILLNRGGERLGRPILSPPPLGSNLSINLSVLGLKYPYTESEHSWLTYLKEKFKLQAFSQMILLNRGGERLGRPILSPLYYFLTFLFISES